MVGGYIGKTNIEHVVGSRGARTRVGGKDLVWLSIRVLVSDAPGPGFHLWHWGGGVGQ